jgi:hypothetical protein
LELKKSLAVLAGAGALLAFMPIASHAQAADTGAASGPFADVPTDHWAYNAVNTLQKAGIVIGYPDGTYGGRRAMTRYEFATAIARLLPMIGANNDYATTDQLNDLRSDLEAKLAANQAALDALTRLVNEFQPELEQLGQNVAAIQVRLANLEGRVAAVEAEQQRFRVTGEINFVAESDTSTHREGDKTYTGFLDKNGVLQPTLNSAPGGNARAANNDFFNATDVYNDVLLHLTGKISDTATAHVDLDFQNYESNLGNTARVGDPTAGLAGQTTPTGALTSGQYSTYVYKAYLDTPVALGPLAGASLQIGRIGTQFTKWTLMQPDADIYTVLPETDSGDLIADGAKLNAKIGPLTANFFAGKYNTTPFSQAYVGTATNPAATNDTSTATNGPTANGGGTSFVSGVQTGSHPAGTFTSLGASINNAAPINQGAGARFTLGAPSSLVLGATVEQFAVGNNLTGTNFTDPNTGRSWDRESVYGLDLNGGLPFALPFLKKGAVTLNGSYTESAQGANSGFNNAGNGYRYSQQEYLAGFNLGRIAFQGGYQYVGPEFAAPGYWGKIGDWTNPTNVEGEVYNLKIPVTHRLAVNADYEAYKAAYGRNANGNGFVDSPLQQNDHVNRYQAGISYGLSSAYAVDLGYEDVQYDLRNTNGTLLNAGKPDESYLTLGLGHSFNKNASFKLLYQIVHYNDHNTGFGSPAPGTSDRNYSGNVAVGQFSLKF